MLVSPPSGTLYSRFSALFFGQGLLMGSHNGAVDEQAVVASVLYQQANAYSPPPATAQRGTRLCTLFALAIALGQIAPADSRVQCLQYAVG